MSGLNAEEVRVALTGHVYFVPLGKTFPTDMKPVTDGIDLGYTTEEGVSFSFSKDTEDIMGWQTKDPLRKLVTAEPKSCSFTLRQLSRDTWLSTMGGTISKNTDESYLWEPDDGKQLEGTIIVEFIDGDKKARFGFRRAAQTATVEFSLVRTDAVNLPNEWTALATKDGSKASFAVFDDDAFQATTANPDPVSP